MSKSNNNGGPLTGFLKWGGPFFLEIEIKKGDPFAARGWRSGSCGRGDPDGREGLLKMKTAAPDGDDSASTDQAKAPGKEATEAFYGARRPLGD